MRLAMARYGGFTPYPSNCDCTRANVTVGKIDHGAMEQWAGWVRPNAPRCHAHAHAHEVEQAGRYSPVWLAVVFLLELGMAYLLSTT